MLWAVKEKAKPGRELTKRQRARNRRFGKVRAKVEHVFRVVKCQFGYRKVRYRGIDKNGAQLFALLRARQHLPRSQPTCVRMKEGARRPAMSRQPRQSQRKSNPGRH